MKQTRKSAKCPVPSKKLSLHDQAVILEHSLKHRDIGQAMINLQRWGFKSCVMSIYIHASHQSKMWDQTDRPETDLISVAAIHYENVGDPFGFVDAEQLELCLTPYDVDKLGRDIAPEALNADGRPIGR